MAGYVAPGIRALESLSDFIDRPAAVVAGDFNANVIWGKRSGKGRRFADILKLTEDKGLASAWHHANRESHGSETRAPIFHMWSEAKPYHVDYAFVSSDLLPSVASVSLGAYADWVAPRISDHVPMSVHLISPLLTITQRDLISGDG